MNTPASTSVSTSENQRRLAVVWVVLMAAIIALPASHRYGQQFLARHQRGELSFMQITAMLLTSVYLVLYRSWTLPLSASATRP